MSRNYALGITFCRIAAALSVAAYLVPAHAQRAAAPSAATTATSPAAPSGQVPAPHVQAKLQQLYPKTAFRSVMTTPVEGVYEVVMGKTISYVDASGRYFFFGNLFDMVTRTDMTQPKIAAASAIDPRKLPLQDAIKIVKGDGKRVLYVFSDPDCPACRALEPTLAQLTNVTIHIFPYPLVSIHPDASRKVRNIWCASDRAKAWTDWMLEKKPAPDRECEHPVDRNLMLAQQLEINATPTLISADGRKQAGALGQAALEAFINGPTSVAAR